MTAWLSGLWLLGKSIVRSSLEQKLQKVFFISVKIWAFIFEVDEKKAGASLKYLIGHRTGSSTGQILSFGQGAYYPSCIGPFRSRG